MLLTFISCFVLISIVIIFSVIATDHHQHILYTKMLHLGVGQSCGATASSGKDGKGGLVNVYKVHTILLKIEVSHDIASLLACMSKARLWRLLVSLGDTVVWPREIETRR